MSPYRALIIWLISEIEKNVPLCYAPRPAIYCVNAFLRKITLTMNSALSILHSALFIMERPMEASVNENLCYKLHYLTRLLMMQLNEKTKPYGVTQGQLPVIFCLTEKEGQTQAELCEHIQVEQPTMANTLRRMERDGLIYRTACNLDKRQSRIFLTEQTRPTVNTLLDKRDEVLSRMAAHMSPEELSSLQRLVDLAIQAMENPESN